MHEIEPVKPGCYCNIVRNYVLFPRNSKLLHLGYKIEDARSHEIDGGNNDDEAMLYVVWVKIILRSSFVAYRCNGRFILLFYNNAFIIFLYSKKLLKRLHATGKNTTGEND